MTFASFTPAALRTLGLRGLGGALLAALSLVPRLASAGPVEATFHTSKPGSTLTVDHSAWTTLLQTYVKPQSDGLNRADYARFKAEGRAALTTYLAQLQAVDPGQLDKPEQFAFWANLYNAKTIDVVVEAYPVTSIKKITFGNILASGPWSKKVLRVSGTELSLDDIEHNILRPYFKDPRVHYAVNCASIGCPNLGVVAFTGAQLSQQLDAAARAFVNHPRGIKVSGGRVMASKIYSWFQKDFGKGDADVLEHARGYASPPLAAALGKVTTIDSFDYDWSLNDITR